jgi:hypothetical protein
MSDYPARAIIKKRSAPTQPAKELEQCDAAPIVDNTAFDRLAGLIAGNVPAPAWLARGLEAAARSVEWVAKCAAQQPGRQEMRRRIADLREAAITVQGYLNDKAVMRTLIDSAGDDLAHDRQAWHGLQSLIQRSETALALPGLRVGKGRGKHDPDRNGEEVCAMVVAVAWHEVRGARAPHATAETNEACNVFWALATGETLPDNTNTIARWRDRLREANRKLDAGDVQQDGATAQRILRCAQPDVAK